MKHLHEDELVLHFYGEADATAATHLAGCATCREALERLEHELAPLDTFAVPERPADYPAHVWQRVAAELESAPAPRRAARFAWPRLAWPRLAVAGAVAALVLAVFWAGYGVGRRAEPIPAPVRERILLIAVGDHLERSQRLLIELSHAGGDGPIDVPAWRRAAGELADSNRLYRQTAARAGDETVAGLLDELERLLLEIANAPDDMPRADLAELQRRIERQGLLFKIRVVGDGARQQAAVPPPRT